VGGLILAQLILEVFGYHHGIKQMLGIALLYNSRLRKEGALSAEKTSLLDRVEWADRILFGLFLPTFLLLRATEILMSIEGQPLLHSFVESGLQGSRVLTLVFGGLLVANAFRHARAFADYEKLAYYGRFSLFGLVALGPFPAFMSACLLASHGSEYFGIYDRAQSNSTAPGAQKRTAFWIALAGCTCMVPFVFINHMPDLHAFLDRRALALPFVLKILASIEGGLDFTHYWIDRQMFRMRIPAVRRHIAPLLNGRRAA
ncbi:MAG: hypothetical protein AAB250_08335, partial [Bdellovibrionota bacterium]